MKRFLSFLSKKTYVFPIKLALMHFLSGIQNNKGHIKILVAKCESIKVARGIN